MFNSSESTVCQLSGHTPNIIATVYRPPKTYFLNDFAAFLTYLSTISPNNILLGDFNIHMGKINPFTRDFTSCLEGFGFQQHINVPTHTKGHILYLIRLLW